MTSPDSTTVAYCQNCGRPLTAAERRDVSGAVFCEPCLAERLRAAAPHAAGAPYFRSPATPPYAGSAPIPALAALLGFIPGVGAMYNGQYAKGLAHLFIFAVLVSLADHHGPFGILVAGWIFYQVVEAHHTARARRDGTPIPNPLGLNDIGERLGFNRTSFAGTPYAGTPGPSGTSNVPPVTPAAGAEPGSANAANGYTWEEEPRSPGEAPPAPFASSSYEQQAPYTQQAPPYTQQAPPYTQQAPPHAQQATYTPVADSGMPPRPSSRFPMGALWLIGLGVFFLIGNVGIFRGFRIVQALPFLIIGFGAWVFTLRMTRSGRRIQNDGSAQYYLRLISALQGSVWIILLGVLFLLDNTGVLSWGRSWPLWIILAGVMAALPRILTSSRPIPGPAVPYPSAGSGSGPGFGVGTEGGPAANPEGGLIVAPPRDGEGRQV